VSLSIYVDIYTYVHACVYVYLRAFVCEHRCVWCACKCVRLRVRTCVFMCLYVSEQMLWSDISQTCVCVCVYVWLCVFRRRCSEMTNPPGVREFMEAHRFLGMTIHYRKNIFRRHIETTGRKHWNATDLNVSCLDPCPRAWPTKCLIHSGCTNTRLGSGVRRNCTCSVHRRGWHCRLLRTGTSGRDRSNCRGRRAWSVRGRPCGRGGRGDRGALSGFGRHGVGFARCEKEIIARLAERNNILRHTNMIRRFSVQSAGSSWAKAQCEARWTISACSLRLLSAVHVLPRPSWAASSSTLPARNWTRSDSAPFTIDIQQQHSHGRHKLQKRRARKDSLPCKTLRCRCRWRVPWGRRQCARRPPQS